MSSILVTGSVLMGAFLTTSAAAMAPGGPANDLPCDAIALDLNVAVAFDNTGASGDPDEVTPGIGSGGNGCNATDGWCDSDPLAQVSVWFTFVASDADFIRISAGPVDYQLAVWTTDDCSNYETYVEVGANDDSGPGFSPRITFDDLTPGVTYYVQIDGWQSETGAGEIVVEEFNRPANDDICNAQWLELDSVNPFTNDLASVEEGEVMPGVGSGDDSCDATDGWCVFDQSLQNTVWFMFEAPECGCLTIDVLSQVAPQDYQMAVYRANSCDFDSLTLVAANDDGGPQFAPALVDLELEPFGLYYIQIDGFNGFDAPGEIILTTETMCGTDCNGNGIADSCDIAEKRVLDCNCNGIPDRCELVAQPWLDLYPRNGVLDDCDECIVDYNCDGEITFDDLWLNLTHLQAQGVVPMMPYNPNPVVWWNWVWSFTTGCSGFDDVMVTY